MALINRAIPSLFNGVSQQPAQLRLPSQCEASVNYYPTVASGLRKRPAVNYLAKLTTTAGANAAAHLINRDATERYAVVLVNGDLEVFDAFTGTKKTVNFPNGKSYLGCVSPRSDFSLVTIADHTFIVNRTKTVAMTAAVAPSNANAGYVVFSYYGAGVQRAMEISVDGVIKATYSGASADISTVVNGMVSALTTNLGAGWTVSKMSYNIIYINRTGATTPWVLTASDDYGSATMKVVKDAVAQFSDLPFNIADGYIAKVSTKPEQAGAGYYVKYVTADKSYVECPKPGVLTTLDPATMPHRLVREADGTFTFEQFTWDARTVGDDVSNPIPSFVGGTINDVFLYRNRLGFLSGENISISESGNYFNFFAKSAATVIDSDPIDASTPSSQVSILTHAVPFNKVLMLFSDMTQFQLSGGDTLTPRTVKADIVTEFASSSLCRPIGAGSELFFVTDRGGFSGVREYFVDQNSLSNDAADVTAHVPSYIPTGVFKAAVSTTEDVLFLLSDTEPNSIYVYKYMWAQEEKAQSAWCKFTLGAGDAVIGCEFIGTKAYLVIHRADGMFLSTMELQASDKDTGLNFSVCLDHKVSLTGVYDAGTNLTTWTLPWAYAAGTVAVLGSAFLSRKGEVLQTTQGTTNLKAVASGDWSAGAAFLGVPYEARFRFSEQFVKDKDGVSIASARLKLRRMLVSYVDSAYFTAEVTPLGREKYSYTFSSRTLGTAGMLLGSIGLASGSFRFPVMTASRGTVIELVNASPLPSTFQGAEWDAELVLQAAR